MASIDARGWQTCTRIAISIDVNHVQDAAVMNFCFRFWIWKILHGDKNTKEMASIDARGWQTCTRIAVSIDVNHVQDATVMNSENTHHPSTAVHLPWIWAIPATKCVQRDSESVSATLGTAWVPSVSFRKFSEALNSQSRDFEFDYDRTERF